MCRAGDSLPSRSVCVELGTVYRAVVCLPSWGQFTEPCVCAELETVYRAVCVCRAGDNRRRKY